MLVQEIWKEAVPQANVIQGDLTLGIVTADRYDKLSHLLRSLPTLFQRFHIAIIDNSIDGSWVRSSEWWRLFDFLSYNGFDTHYLMISHGLSMFSLRQTLLESCETSLLWFVDDDVAFVENPLTPLVQRYGLNPNCGYVQGSKIDIENTEGYSNWAIEKTTKESIGEIPCWFYKYAKHWYAKTCVMDCGNVLVDVKKAKAVGGFNCEGVVSGHAGEDVLLGARLSSRYPCYYESKSIAFHFPKQRMRFGTKDPKWLWPQLEKECSKTVLKNLWQFYNTKFNWEKKDA